MEINDNVQEFYDSLSDYLKENLPINYLLMKSTSDEMYKEITKHHYSRSSILGTNYHYTTPFYKPISKILILTK